MHSTRGLDCCGKKYGISYSFVSALFICLLFNFKERRVWYRSNI